ncbi:MAG: ATP phosphoribosyltransferase [Oscillospiraceae bacterium]|nr:ATP phosphoribosyltransferase [Oscillospiraceae bacterium]
MISIALPKGRLGEKAIKLFQESGIIPGGDIGFSSRKLVLELPESGVRFFLVKPSDVAIYVERGAADIGIVGKDILVESSPDVYEVLDLGMGKCRMCVAAKKDFRDNPNRTLSVATKFPTIASEYYERQSRRIDVIKLNGSIELAPILGLSDVIVDIVETGDTLRENDLEVFETIFEISARLILNKSAAKFKSDEISGIVSKISEIIEAKG